MAPVTPTGPYPPTDIKDIKEVKAKTEAFNGHIEDLDKWVNSLENEQLNAVIAYLTKKDMKELKKKMSKEDIIYNPHGEYDGMDLGADKDRTVYTYKHDGRIDTLDLHDAPRFRMIYWRDKFKATREELEKQDIPYWINPRLRQAEIDGLKSMESDLEEQIRKSKAVLEEQIRKSKAVSADVHEQPEPEDQARNVAQSVNYRKSYGLRTNKEVGEALIEAEMASQLKIRTKTRAAFKKERWNKVLTVFYKVMIIFVGIIYGLIILENILVGKPIATFLNRVLTGE